MAVPTVLDRPAALLRGTARGLELVVQAQLGVDAIVFSLVRRLDEAPAFFRGSDMRIRVEEGPLPTGCLARLDEIATRYALRIVEVTASRPTLVDSDAVPKQPNLAAGSAPSPATPAIATLAPSMPSTAFDDEGPTNHAALAFVDPPVATCAAPAATSDAASHAMAEAIADATPAPAERIRLAAAELTELAALVDEPMAFAEEPTQTAVPLSLAATAEAELETVTPGTRLVVGPVRSGVILEHTGHLIIFGDVNPGAEIRAEGNIVVLGRLRGTAHAGIGQDVGFILSLRLEPQQLRIGRKVARAADSDTAAAEAEIAYCTGDSIVVERYLGKLPRNLATSI